MTTEERLKRLEEIVVPDDQDGSNLGEFSMAIYGQLIKALILLGDFSHDLATSCGNLMNEIGKLIPEEIMEDLQNNVSNTEAEPKLHIVSDNSDPES